MATKIDDSSRQDTDSEPSSNEIPTLSSPEFELHLDISTLASSLTLPEDSPRLLSPIQNNLSSAKHKHPFNLSNLLNGVQGGLESIGPEVANAEIKFAADTSFIESSSGAAIRELKLYYDQRAGVGPTFRSPYAIAGFTNQHGKSMYRLIHREEQTMTGSSADAEDRMTQSKAANDSPHSPHTKRRSRLSMHFLPPGMFKNPTPTHSGKSKLSSTSHKKLHRKTGSTPDLAVSIVGDGDHTPITGRGHSQSVTAADGMHSGLIFQSATRRTDAFGELLDLIPSLNGSAHTIIISSDPIRSRGTIFQPFGPGVTFNPPNRKERHRPHRQLREMQSFESSVTARQDDDHLLQTDDFPERDHELNRPPSAIRLSQYSQHPDTTPEPDPEPEPLSQVDSDTDEMMSSQLLSQYSPEVFNVIQKYSGLPVFESLVPEADEGTTVIKLSLSNSTNIAPRDDPRFVIWGEYHPDSEYEELYSSTRGSPTEMSPSLPFSTLSSRRSSKTTKSKLSDAPSSRLVPSEGGQRVFLAATIERWIAQLTSDLNYDELLNFFLTYRAYVSAVDLCHLLICRFHWTLHKASSREDEAVRRIVRVRTFVAIRYWLLTFFTVDFIPNRELRLLISDWLNTLLHDPVLRKHMDSIGIIRRLIKVAKDCKKAHIKTFDKPKPSRRSPSPEESEHVLGKSFAQATKKDEESDLDLDFLPDEASTEEAVTGFPNDPANAHLTVGHVAGAVVLGQTRPTSLPLSSLGILQRPDHVSVPPNVDSAPVLQSLQTHPPTKNSSLSRAFVKTIGRLGRWKRVFHPRSPTLTPKASVPVNGGVVSAFDLELNASVDLLSSEVDMEEYLKLSQTTMSESSGTSLLASSSLTAVGSMTQLPTTPPLITPTALKQLHKLPPTPESPLDVTSSPPPITDTDLTLPSPPLSPVLDPLTISVDEVIQHEPSDVSSVVDLPTEPILFNGNPVTNATKRPESFQSTSTDSFGSPLTSDGPLLPAFPSTETPWQFDVVSIDDVDFSDTSSFVHDPHNPPGLRKQRKLPMRRDFEFVRRSEVSSMGIISHESMRDSVNSSTPSEASPTSSGGAGPMPIQRWQMKSLQQTFEEMSSHSDDKGDVEAALRRLEGQINPKQVQENADKVDGWLNTLRERMVNGDYANSIYSEGEMEDFFDEANGVSPTSTEARLLPASDAIIHTPNSTHQQLPTPPSANVSPKHIQTRIEEVVPLEILNSRMSTIPVASNPPTVVHAPSKGPHLRSFIHNCSSEQLAHHFTMIDRELFICIKFEELVTGEWLDCEEIDIVDWAQYLKDRARWKAESRNSDKTTALAAVRARFNLMVSFVNAEVVLTPPNERLFVVSKFIRIAWRCYQLSNFQSLTAIMVGLQSEWVNQAMRKPGWNRLDPFESRLFRDFKQFTSKYDDFQIMRQVVDSIVDSKLDPNSRAASIISGGATDHSGKSKPSSDGRQPVPSTCIPFIGIYLSQLRRINKLPALIDPTSPHTFMGCDQVTANFDLPAYPEVFASLAPLPASMQLEPLINVRKQRRVAEVIKSLVAGQHLASRVHFDVDRKLFQKCLRLRGLDFDRLERALNLYVD